MATKKSVKAEAEKKWFKVSNRVSLPINQNPVDENFVPKDVPFEDTKKTLEQVAVAISWNMPVLLVGELGTGKTSLVRHLAHETHNGFVRYPHNGGTSVEDILGRWCIVGGETIWIDGLLIDAMKNGWWYFADEINAATADCNFLYNSLLDDDGFIVLAEKGKEIVVPHPNFRFIAAMNPPAEYTGTKDLNKALLSRFMVVHVDFPAPDIEEKILMDRTGVSQEVAENMVKFAVDVRNSKQKESTQYVLSTRDMIMWARMYKVFGKYIQAADMAILNKISGDDINAITTIMNLKFKELDK